MDTLTTTGWASESRKGRVTFYKDDSAVRITADTRQGIVELSPNSDPGAYQRIRENEAKRRSEEAIAEKVTNTMKN